MAAGCFPPLCEEGHVLACLRVGSAILIQRQRNGF